MPIKNNPNQVQISVRDDGVTEFEFMAESRCESCIRKNYSPCIIQIGSNYHKIAICDDCRVMRKSKIHYCRPKLEILEKYFPNHPQILHSRVMFTKWISKSRLVSNNTTKEDSNKINKGKRKNKSKMIARKPKMKIPSRLINQVEINATSSSMSVSSNSSSNQSVQSEISFDDQLTFIPSSSNSNFRPAFTVPAQTQTQTQANLSIVALEDQQENRERLKESISNRLADIEEMLELQKSIIMRGMKRDLEAQKTG